MKHGDKKKGKASKAAGKKSSKASKSKVVKSVKGAKSAKNAKVKSSAPKASEKTGKPRDNGGGAARSRAGTDVGFSNPAVGAAFKQAVKKYPNAFRKLTD